jgi:glycosyltransferase involved in cell wall biosynthesis
MPELEIWAWGKSVLGDPTLDFSTLPPNIRLQGTFANFDDLPFESSDFLLYTSEWDGLPTILIDAGARGVATVASSVGGVGDLITVETGFPVDDPVNPDAYVDAIARMVDDPRTVTLRARNFRSHTASLCARERYLSTLREAIGE